MQTEKEFLKEVAQMLESIRRTPEEYRKNQMRNHLHSQVYPKKYLYGFASIDAVKKSIEYLKSGQPDPTRGERYRGLLRTIDRLTKAANSKEWEKEREREAEKMPSSTTFLLKLTRIDSDQERDAERDRSSHDREYDGDLDRD